MNSVDFAEIFDFVSWIRNNGVIAWLPSLNNKLKEKLFSVLETTN